MSRAKQLAFMAGLMGVMTKGNNSEIGSPGEKAMGYELHEVTNKVRAINPARRAKTQGRKELGITGKQYRRLARNTRKLLKAVK